MATWRTLGAANQSAKGAVKDSSDAVELTDKLSQLLQHSRDPLYRQEARRLAEQFSWPKHFAKLDALLKEVAQ